MAGLDVQACFEKVHRLEQNDKNDYQQAMRTSPVDDGDICRLLRNALTDKINDRELFMKSIDYSYYYEQPD